MNYDKGVVFEKYVHSLFDRNYFSIVSWTRDIDNKHDIRVENDSDPDFIIRYIPSNEKFAVECKFRSSLYNDKLCWTTWEKLGEYNKFAEENVIPIFIVIGLEGDPDYPRYMICMPLSEAKYPELYPSIFENYMRNPRKKFFWKNGMLS